MEPVVRLWSHTPSIPPTAGYLSSGYGVRISPFSRRNESDEGLLGYHTGIDISNAMPPGGEGPNRTDPKVARLMNQQRQMVSSMGQFLGEDAGHDVAAAAGGGLDQHQIGRAHV